MKKPKITWAMIGTAIQITVGIIEIGILIFQCLTNKEEDEE